MELTEQHLIVASDAWAAARDGKGIVIKPDYFFEAHELLDGLFAGDVKARPSWSSEAAALG
jgi:hypothetical protein